VFSQLKAARLGAPRKGPSIARAARPLGFAAVALAAAVTVAGCKPGSITSATPGGAHPSGSMSSGSMTTGSSMSALSLAAQRSQQIRSFTANLEIQASGALHATLTGTLKEATTPSPLIAVRARAGALGRIRLILANGMVYLKSPLLARVYHKPWVAGPASAMGQMSSLNLGPLLGLLQTASPAVQLPLFSQGMNVRQMGAMASSQMGAMGSRMTEFGGHYRLSSAMHSMAAGLQPSVQSMMNNGLNMTRFRVWMGNGHMVHKLVLIVLGRHTRIVITLVITSVNRPVRIQLPQAALIFVLGGATPTPSMTPTMMPSATPSTSMTPAPTPTGTAPGMDGTPTAVPTTGPTHW
jgi:hypothetical protein